ncbi:MAG: NAD(P)-dependent oxidoreductase [Pirellulales bacterium]
MSTFLRRVLVSGAAGYLGRHVCKALAELKDVQVVAHVRREPKESILGAEQLIELDLEQANTEDWLEVLNQIDAAIWLAGADAKQCSDDPIRAVKLNVEGLLKFAQAASKSGVKRIVFASTFHVYGTTESMVITEGTLPNPSHPYPASKLAAEYFLNTVPMETVVVRLSNAVGKPLGASEQAWKLVANNMCQQAVKTRQITVTTPGQYRDFVSIRDAAKAFVHMINISPRSLHSVINVGGDRCLSMVELAELISVQSSVSLGFVPEVNVLSQGMRNNSFKFKIDQLLSSGFCFSSTLEAEISDCLNHCATHLNSADVR